MFATISNKLLAVSAAAKARLRDERGQTAAEYLGVIVVIGVIIGVLATSGIGEEIADAIKDAIDDISG
jgi:Flp pilus assembly pilin Flp